MAYSGRTPAPSGKRPDLLLTPPSSTPAASALGRTPGSRTRSRRQGGFFLSAGVVAAAVVAAGPPDAAAGDAKRGQRLYAEQCLVCHALEPEYHKEGPSLAGIYGRTAGTQPFFPRYVGLKRIDVVWNEATLDAWLADPRAFLAGRNTTMAFRVTDAEARADIIAYLKSDP